MASDEIHCGSKAKITRYDIWALGITVVIGGQYFSWNSGLEAGFGSYVLATFLIGSSYTCLCMCMSELSSALPFAGGAYGLARCTLGFYTGFIIGCCETIEYMIYVATSAISLGEMLASVNESWSNYQPLIWLVFYVSALFVHIKGGRIFWRTNFLLAIVSIVIIIIFICGSGHYGSFTKNAPVNGDEWFIGGMSRFMAVLPIAGWFFVGVEALNFACSDIDDPEINIPWGQLSCITTLNITAFLVLFMSCSLPIGTDGLKDDLNPLDSGTPLGMTTLLFASAAKIILFFIAT